MTGKSSKLQDPSSREALSSKLQDAHLAGLKATEFGIWFLGLLWSLNFDGWSLLPGALNDT
jgi:hypothetical protein